MVDQFLKSQATLARDSGVPGPRSSQGNVCQCLPLEVPKDLRLTPLKLQREDSQATRIYESDYNENIISSGVDSNINEYFIL